jgi:hypothetical protein
MTVYCDGGKPFLVKTFEHIATNQRSVIKRLVSFFIVMSLLQQKQTFTCHRGKNSEDGEKLSSDFSP